MFAAEETRKFENLTMNLVLGIWTHVGVVVDPHMPGIQLWRTGEYVGYVNQTIDSSTDREWIKLN